MTELIVALDGPNPLRLMDQIWRQTSIRWFKIGPQAMVFYDWTFLIGYAKDWNLNLFLDLKLADTRDTINESVKRFADAGIAAVSTSTSEAMEAAMSVDRGELHIWHLSVLSDSQKGFITADTSWWCDGIICPPWNLELIRQEHYKDKVVPGVRFAKESRDGHTDTIEPNECKRLGATHIVVGRPIWQAIDPVWAARRYLDALAD